jgi:tetratricopeptide (TPR) repeat protein
LNRRTLFLIAIALAVLLIAALCVIFIKCDKKETPTQVGQIEEPAAVEEEIIEEQEEVPAVEPDIKTEARVSYQVSRPLSSLSGLSKIRGKMGVLVSEIDPLNYENPDLDVLRQMGADPSLISHLAGEQYYRKGDYDKAISEYTAAINRNSEFLQSYISRGNAWMKKRDYSRAIDDYTRAIKLNGNKAEVYNYRGFAREEMAARNNFNGMALAIEDYSRAISINKNYVDALINRSHAYYQTGDFARVIEDCDRIIALEPSNAVIWNRRGSAWYARENDDRAITDFTEAIRLKSDYAIAWYNRANAWYNKRELEKSLADLNKCLSINPSFADAYTSRGKVYQLMDNIEKAEADFASAQRLKR